MCIKQIDGQWGISKTDDRDNGGWLHNEKQWISKTTQNDSYTRDAMDSKAEKDFMFSKTTRMLEIVFGVWGSKATMDFRDHTNVRNNEMNQVLE